MTPAAWDAGLTRINISLDALTEETFRKIARRDGLDRVLAGIAAAKRAGFRKIRLNAVAIKGMTEDDVVPLARFEPGICDLREAEGAPVIVGGLFGVTHPKLDVVD